MKIFIINMEKSTDRKEFMQKQLNSLELDYSFIEAVTPDSKNFDKIIRYNNKKRMVRVGAPMSGGEIACFASHYSLWKKCIELDETIIVLEDDVKIRNNFISVVKQLEKSINNYKYIRLHGYFDHKYSVIETLSSTQTIVKCFKPPSGAAAYILTPFAAKRFIGKADEWCEAVDTYMDRFWYHGVECYAVMPYIVEAGGIFNSEIGKRFPSNITILKKIIREIIRTSKDVSMLFHNFIFVIKQYLK
jgi:glycosyl transferase, family 25